MENYDISNLQGWTRGYYKPYSHKTTSDELKSICDNSDNIIIFVGGIKKDSPNNIILGAFGSSDTLHNYTDSTSIAYIPSKWKQSKYNVYWYHYNQKSFGFSKESKIVLNAADFIDKHTVFDAFSQFRLSWHLDGRGGWRIGTKRNLTYNNDYYKIVYYKNIS